MITKTLKVRVKDRHAGFLRQGAREVNLVWNYVNDLGVRYLRREGVFLSGYDLQKYTKGASRLLVIDSTAIQVICEEYATRRRQFKKTKLAWRKSHGVRRSLGWIPFKSGAATWGNGQVKYAGQHFKVFDSYGLSQYRFRAGSFSEDARGRWYFNVVVEIEPKKGLGQGAVGIDLGCKAAATDSNGEGVRGREYRKLEKQLACAQRAKNKARVKAIHAKIRNRRQDSLHKYSRKLVNENAAIFVGNVSSQKLVKTHMAKSVLDAGWSTLKRMMSYKSAHAGIVFREVNEANTTVTCSECKSHTGPRGLEGLRIRGWRCEVCGTHHACRDRNSAINILAAGLSRLDGEKVAA
ncbi:MAG: IS200/IS605 family element transposase accessory protein TnpB [Hahellaceae bacterium]|nr:IS200/IS605 family element transposase accessory protein TnpB [Hahellaceae bacterium]